MNLDSNRGVVLILLDLSVTFDIIDHSLIIQRFESHIGFKATAVEWFRSYLDHIFPGSLHRWSYFWECSTSFWCSSKIYSWANKIFNLHFSSWWHYQKTQPPESYVCWWHPVVCNEDKTETCHILDKTFLLMKFLFLKLLKVWGTLVWYLIIPCLCRTRYANFNLRNIVRERKYISGDSFIILVNCLISLPLD